VKIDLHEQLIAWRATDVPRGWRERLFARIAAAVFARPALYRAAGRAARWVWPVLSRRWPGNPASSWLASRELPAHPGASFNSRWRAKTREERSLAKPNGERRRARMRGEDP
jgi:hypothetical protein